MLSHVLEQHGIATVAIASIRDVVERLRPPRALYCEFPLGRPLGIPGDAAFQHRVLAAALDLLTVPDGPVLRDFPEAIHQQADLGLACPLPPSSAPSGTSTAVAEARGLMLAQRRARDAMGRTNVGRFVPAEDVPDVVGRFEAIAAGTDPRAAGIRAEHLMAAASDVRAYYEEASLALVAHVPAAGQADAWFYRDTAAGRALVAAWTALASSDLRTTDWLYIVPRAFHPRTPD